MIQLQQVRFAYADSGFRLRVPEFRVSRGERVALIGPSGSGKTTLLNLIAGITATQSGNVVVSGAALHDMSNSARRRFRVARLGLVFQEFDLLEYLNVLENIALPLRLRRSGPPATEMRARATRLAEELGIGDKLRRMPHQLSQGERQRVAIGRALIADPVLLLADEPTGNLDPVGKSRVLDLMLSTADQRDLTVLLVTHDHSLLDRFQRVVDVGLFHDSRPAGDDRGDAS